MCVNGEGKMKKGRKSLPLSGINWMLGNNGLVWVFFTLLDEHE